MAEGPTLQAFSSNPEASGYTAQVQALIPLLQGLLGKRYVLDRPEERLVYECDACLLLTAPPDLVVLPATPQEVAAIVKLCREHQVPYIARGAGTGLSGGALPVNGGVIIGLNRLNRIVEIDADHRTATVEAGVVNAWLNRELLPYNLFYAPDPSSQSACTLGGNIAENAGGIHCIKYGVTSDHILGLEVVLPDGSLTWVGGKTRHSHGLNLTGLMVGSEGTLGIVTRAIVKLLPRPQTVRVYLAAFEATAQATGTVSRIIESGLVPSALEFMDRFTVQAVNEAFGVGFPQTSEAVLLIELDGTPMSLSHQEPKLLSILESFQACQIRVAESEEERSRLWAARKGAVAAYGRMLPAFYLHDCVIPRSELTSVLTQIQQIAKAHQITIGNVFHAGDGNLHPNILFDPDDPEMVKRVLQGGEEILKVCLAAGGTLSGEHGIGIEKSQYMPLVYSPEDLNQMLEVKSLFDPEGLANPAKIFPVRKGCGETKNALQHPLLAQGEAWI